MFCKLYQRGIKHLFTCDMNRAIPTSITLAKGFGSKQDTLEIPKAPKRPVGPYILFMKSEHKATQEELGSTATPINIMKRIGEKWQQLDQVSKKAYQDKYLIEKDDYDRTCLSYQKSLTPEQKKTIDDVKKINKAIKKLKINKPAGAPTKPRSSYNFYVMHVASNVTNTKELLKTIGEKWKSLPDEEKMIFQKKAADDSIRYENEMASFKPKSEVNLDFGLLKIDKLKTDRRKHKSANKEK